MKNTSPGAAPDALDSSMLIVQRFAEERAEMLYLLCSPGVGLPSGEVYFQFRTWWYERGLVGVMPTKRFVSAALLGLGWVRRPASAGGGYVPPRPASMDVVVLMEAISAPRVDRSTREDLLLVGGWWASGPVLPEGGAWTSAVLHASLVEWLGVHHPGVVVSQRRLSSLLLRLGWDFVRRSGGIRFYSPPAG